MSKGMPKPRRYAAGTDYVSPYANEHERYKAFSKLPFQREVADPSTVDPNDPDYDFKVGKSSVSLYDLQPKQPTPSSIPNPIGNLPSLSSNLDAFTPPRLDLTEETTFNTGALPDNASRYQRDGEFIPTGPGSTEYEDNLRTQLETRQRLREETEPKKKPGVIGTRFLNAGTERVPGKGDGTKDTVAAKLAPGEAVLNKAAADFMGRGLIKKINKMGMMKMGMTE